MFSFKTKQTAKTIKVNDLPNLIGQINLIDIREPYEYHSGHIPTAKNIPMNMLLSNPNNYMDQAKEYYIICQSGGRSQVASRMLLQHGFNVIDVLGGTGSYRGSLE